MKVVYIAGPFRGSSRWQEHKNILAAEAMAWNVWDVGAVAICPHLNTCNFQDSQDDEVWLAGDIEILTRCDAVVVVGDWKSSEGTKREIARAEELGIPVFFDTKFEYFEEWLSHGQ